MYVYRQRLYTAVQLVLDVLSFLPIWLCASRLRIAIDPVMERHLSVQTAPDWVAPLGIILLLWLAVSFRLQLYLPPERIRPWTILRWAGENTIALSTVAVLATFLSRQFGKDASRMFVLCMIPTTFVIFLVTRCAALAVIAMIQRRWPPPRIALIGDLVTAKRFIGQIQLQIRSAIRGLIVPEGTVVATVGHPLHVLGTTGQIAELFNRERIDRVILLQSSIPDSELELCNKVAWRMGLPVSCALDLEPEPDPSTVPWGSRRKLALSNQFGLQVVEIQTAHSSQEDRFKRLFDFTVASILLIILSPLLFCIALAVKLTSKGPVLEKAPRVGKGGRHFTCLKFRTTVEDLNLPTPEDGNANAPHHATPFGKMLRAYSVDEFPQLINILRNEMSLVGPRPLPADALGPDGMSREYFAWSETRARVHPGMTGLWQISGRNSLSFDDMLRLDFEYIQNRSFALDLSIILETPIAVLRGVGAA